METMAVHQAVSHWLSGQGYANARASSKVDSLHTLSSDAEWFVVMRGDVKESFAYIHKFDQAIDALITRNRAVTNLLMKLGIAVAFSSTLRGDMLSYRKVLNKYTNSIIFTDLEIHLLLVRDDLSVELISPDKVNRFLRNLNTLVAASS